MIDKPLRGMTDAELLREASWRIYNSAWETHFNRGYRGFSSNEWDEMAREISNFLSEHGKNHIYEQAYKQARREALGY